MFFGCSPPGLELILFAYIISLGFGMVVGQQRGLVRAHRFWIWLVTRFIAFVIDLTGQGLRTIATRLKR